MSWTGETWSTKHTKEQEFFPSTEYKHIKCITLAVRKHTNIVESLPHPTVLRSVSNLLLIILLLQKLFIIHSPLQYKILIHPPLPVFKTNLVGFARVLPQFFTSTKWTKPIPNILSLNDLETKAMEMETTRNDPRSLGAGLVVWLKHNNSFNSKDEQMARNCSNWKYYIISFKKKTWHFEAGFGRIWHQFFVENKPESNSETG